MEQHLSKANFCGCDIHRSFSLISVTSRSFVNFLVKEAAFGFNYFSILFLLLNLHDFSRFISFFFFTHSPVFQSLS